MVLALPYQCHSPLNLISSCDAWQLLQAAKMIEYSQRRFSLKPGMASALSLRRRFIAFLQCAGNGKAVRFITDMHNQMQCLAISRQIQRLTVQNKMQYPPPSLMRPSPLPPDEQGLG